MYLLLLLMMIDQVKSSEFYFFSTGFSWESKTSQKPIVSGRQLFFCHFSSTVRRLLSDNIRHQIYCSLARSIGQLHVASHLPEFPCSGKQASINVEPCNVTISQIYFSFSHVSQSYPNVSLTLIVWLLQHRLTQLFWGTPMFCLCFLTPVQSRSFIMTLNESRSTTQHSAGKSPMSTQQGTDEGKIAETSSRTRFKIIR